MSLAKEKYRLITRSDFDGLACAVFLQDLDLINEIMFVHPKDMQDGKIAVTDKDITTNLPYVPGCHLAFDHHYSETLRIPASQRKNHIIDPDAPSAAQVVHQHYGGDTAFQRDFTELLAAVNKSDSAAFEMEEVLHPQGWNLLSFLMDARTGLGRFKDFRISNYQLMMDLIHYCKKLSIEEILKLQDVKERLDLYNSHAAKFDAQVKRCARVHGPLLVIDLRNEDIIYTGNRFKIYALFPECNLSIHLMWGLRKQNAVFAAGKSIFKKDSPINIGELMLRYGGGGHVAAGTCQIPPERAETVLAELIQYIVEKS